MRPSHVRSQRRNGCDDDLRLARRVPRRRRPVDDRHRRPRSRLPAARRSWPRSWTSRGASRTSSSRRSPSAAARSSRTRSAPPRRSSTPSTPRARCSPGSSAAACRCAPASSSSSPSPAASSPAPSSPPPPRPCSSASSALLASPFVAKAYLDRRIRKRHQKFEEQFPEALTLIASSLSAGHTFLRSIQMMTQEAGGPLAEEFGRVVSETELGDPLLDSLAAHGRPARHPRRRLGRAGDPHPADGGRQARRPAAHPGRLHPGPGRDPSRGRRAHRRGSGLRLRPRRDARRAPRLHLRREPGLHEADVPGLGLGVARRRAGASRSPPSPSSSAWSSRSRSERGHLRHPLRPGRRRLRRTSAPTPPPRSTRPIPSTTSAASTTPTRRATSSSCSLQEPFITRVLRPMASRMQGVVSGVLPGNYRDTVHEQLVLRRADRQVPGRGGRHRPDRPRRRRLRPRPFLVLSGTVTGGVGILCILLLPVLGAQFPRTAPAAAGRRAPERHPP